MTLLREREDPGHFGNALVELEGSTLRARLIADRSEIFAEVSSIESEAWWALGDAMRALGSIDAPPGAWQSVHAAVSALEEHLPSIARAVTDRDPRLRGLKEYR